MIEKPDKNITQRKITGKFIYFRNTDEKFLSKIITNQIQQYIKGIMIKWGSKFKTQSIWSITSCEEKKRENHDFPAFLSSL